jgi:hypothetical protein
MQPLPPQRRGLWAPRTRLKILAAVLGLNGISQLSSLLLPDVPAWITLATLLANTVAAVTLWRVASASTPTQPMIGSALLAILASIGVTIVYALQPFLTMEPAVTIPLNIVVGGALLVFVQMSARAIKAEGSPATSAQAQP